jgi:2-haloacid dehalogenase
MPIKAVVFDAYGTLYDIQSVAAMTEQAFPGYGEVATQIWRIKQLEYTWLRSLMGRYDSFWTVTRESLEYTLSCLGLKDDSGFFDRIMEKYLHLDLYPDAKRVVAGLSGYRRAILSNGNQAMLDQLVKNTGLDADLDAVISVESRAIFKPSPAAYELIEERLGVPPSAVLFVSSNGFDVCGAKNFGLRVAWIRRATAQAPRHDMDKAGGVLGPLGMFKALRMQMETLPFTPDYEIGSLSDLSGVLARAK